MRECECKSARCRTLLSATPGSSPNRPALWRCTSPQRRLTSPPDQATPKRHTGPYPAVLRLCKTVQRVSKTTASDRSGHGSVLTAYAPKGPVPCRSPMMGVSQQRRAGALLPCSAESEKVDPLPPFLWRNSEGRNWVSAGAPWVRLCS